MQFNQTDLQKILKHISGNDLARIAIPKQTDLEKILKLNSFQSAFLNSKEMSKALSQNLAIAGLSSSLSNLAEEMKRSYKPQLNAFQAMQKGLEPLLYQQTMLYKEFSKMKAAVSPSFSIFETLASYKSYIKYEETYKEFDGTLNLENYSEEDVKRTIEENKVVISKVNEIVIEAEKIGLPRIDIPEFIFEQLQKLIPKISPRNFAILLTIIIIIFHSYEFYLHYSTEETIQEEVIPQLNSQTEQLNKLSEEDQALKESDLEIENEIGDVHKTQQLTNEKLDSLISEMKSIKKSLTK